MDERSIRIGKTPLVMYLNGRISYCKSMIRECGRSGASDSTWQCRMHELLNMKAKVYGAKRWEGAVMLDKKRMIKRIRKVIDWIEVGRRDVCTGPIERARMELVDILLDMTGKTRSTQVRSIRMEEKDEGTETDRASAVGRRESAL